MTVEEIRRRFEYSTEFNEIFDAFSEALRQNLDDIELYRLLFWNHSLSADECCLFGEKLAKDVPSLAYETFMWLARIFEVTHSMADNYELSFAYYQKAAGARPELPDPYLNAADCYEPDLNIPPIARLINFLKQGADTVPQPLEIYQRLTTFFELVGNDEMLHYYKTKAYSGPGEAPPKKPDNGGEPGKGGGSSESGGPGKPRGPARPGGPGNSGKSKKRAGPGSRSPKHPPAKSGRRPGKKPPGGPRPK